MARKKTAVDEERKAAAEQVAAAERTFEDAREDKRAAHERYRAADEAWQAQEADRRRAEHVGPAGANQTMGV